MEGNRGGHGRHLSLVVHAAVFQVLSRRRQLLHLVPVPQEVPAPHPEHEEEGIPTQVRHAAAERAGIGGYPRIIE